MNAQLVCLKGIVEHCGVGGVGQKCKRNLNLHLTRQHKHKRGEPQTVHKYNGSALGYNKPQCNFVHCTVHQTALQC